MSLGNGCLRKPHRSEAPPLAEADSPRILKRTCAEARVACPQSLISATGVNQRKPNRLPAHMSKIGLYANEFIVNGT